MHRQRAAFQYHRAVRELRPGLWHWGAPHPDWQPSEPWHQEVSSYAIDDGERLLLFDPIAVPEQMEELAASRAYGALARTRCAGPCGAARRALVRTSAREC